MKFLVTGGAGFIGSHLTEALLQQGHSVHVLDNLSTGSQSNVSRFLHRSAYAFTLGDVADGATLEPLVQNCDVVFHLAATVGVQVVVEDPIHCIETNIIGTTLVLKYANKYRRRTFTFSTSEVYGKSTKFPFTEDQDIVLGPVHKLRWSYAASKLVDDYLARSFFVKHQLPVTIVRLFNTIGRGQVGHYGMVVPRFFEQALRGSRLTVYGDGTQTRCFTDVRDVVSALLKLIDCPASHGELINIGSSDEISILRLAEAIRAMTKSVSPIELVSFEQAFGANFEDMDRRVPSTEKLRRIANFQFQYSLPDTLIWIYQDLLKAHAPSPRRGAVAEV